MLLENSKNTMIILASVAVLLYLVCSTILFYRLLHSTAPSAAPARHRLLYVGGSGMVIHVWLVYHGIITPAGINVGVFETLSLVGWLVAMLLVLVTLFEKVESLGVMVFPFAALTVVLEALHLGEPVIVQLGVGLRLHILFSIVAYSLLGIAAIQAVLLYFQERHLHNKHPGGFVRALPSMETMERLLFRMIALGFVILSISLVSGLFYLEDILKQHLVHKSVLSVAAWLVFGTLLFGRWRFGWRGRTAIRWSISGFVMLMLAYFGSKVVLELILGLH